jgi:putative tricarboxylic transport membrane protein
MEIVSNLEALGINLAKLSGEVMLDLWLEGFRIALSPTNILWLLLGTVVGLFVGILPAVGASLGVAVMLPLTFGLDPVTAVIFLVAIHASGNYGDSIASILINVPGGVGTVATCWDGYPLARKGQGGRAIGIATFGSFLGGFMGWLVLVVLARPITIIALRFGAPEYCSLGIMALMLIGIASKEDIIKGIIMACLGLILAFIGEDPISGVVERFSFDLPPLMAGIPIVAACLGIFAISEMISIAEEGGTIAQEGIRFKDSVFSGFADVLKRPFTVLRAWVVGFFIGILPALGTSLAGISSYLTEQTFSKDRKFFGKGAPAGLLAAEVGKGSCVVGDLIPTFTLGIPGSVTCALLMAALTIHGIIPGPGFMKQGAMPYAVFTGIILSQAVFLVSGLGLAKWFSKVLYVPIALIVSSVVPLCFLGSFAEGNRFFDVVIMLGLGILTYGLKRLNYPAVCLVLGLILGPLIESNFHRSLGIELGSWLIFLHRPATVTILGLTVLFVLFPFYFPVLRRLSDRLLKSEDSKNDVELADASQVGGRSARGEFVLLVLILALGLIFLATSRKYTPQVRLVPNLVLWVMLVAAFWRLLRLGRQLVFLFKKGVQMPKTEDQRGEPKAGLIWYWSAVGLIGYAFLTWILGMVVATLIYTFILSWAMGYRRWLVILATAVGNALFLVFLSRAFSLILPRGILF